MAEFTGERVYPEEVEVDLLNEHFARYTFAARVARGRRVLDAGCGAGYGSAELASTAAYVMGIDVAPEAIEFACATYHRPNLEFQRGTVVALPFPDGSLDLVVAFEVIEHLKGWREFLLEVLRVLAPGGQFLVSTPNRLYYTESRGDKGANPFHVHEFDFAEFRRELKCFFPHVTIYLENHVESIAFQPPESPKAVEFRVDTSEPAPDEAHFFVALCGRQPDPSAGGYIYVPRTANVLREREHHIVKQREEIAKKNEWLKQVQRDRLDLLAKYAEQTKELEKSNQWAQSLTQTVRERDARIDELQDEMAREQQQAQHVAEGYAAKVAELEQDVREKTAWAIDTESRLTEEVRRQTDALGKAVDALHETERLLEERTEWAGQLEQEVNRLRGEVEHLSQQLSMVRDSRWVKLGRKVGVGPVIPAS